MLNNGDYCELKNIQTQLIRKMKKFAFEEESIIDFTVNDLKTLAETIEITDRILSGGTNER